MRTSMPRRGSSAGLSRTPPVSRFDESVYRASARRRGLLPCAAEDQVVPPMPLSCAEMSVVPPSCWQQGAIDLALPAITNDPETIGSHAMWLAHRAGMSAVVRGGGAFGRQRRPTQVAAYLSGPAAPSLLQSRLGHPARRTGFLSEPGLAHRLRADATVANGPQATWQAENLLGLQPGAG
jgi:hypothetical protein